MEADDVLLLESYKAVVSELEELGLSGSELAAQIREKFTAEELARIDEQEWEEIRLFFDPDNKERDVLEGITRTAEKLLRIYIFKTMKDTDEIYFYDEDQGVYAAGEKVISSTVAKNLGKFVTSHNVSEIVFRIRNLTYTDRKLFNTDVDKIVVENGVLNLTTGELLPHASEFLCTIKLPLTHDPEADCPRIKKFIEEVVEPGKRDAIYELFGYCLYRKYHINRAFMFNGEGHNGKSTLIKLLQSFLGSENCSTVELQTLGTNRFASARLYGKLANLCADLPAKPLKETGKFKMLTGNDALEGEYKFKTGFSFTNHAKLIFSANRIPPVEYDDTDAFFRRWIIVNFPNQFPEEDPKTDKNLIGKLTTQQELSGLLNLALEGLKRLLAASGFTGSETVEEMREKYTRLSDTTAAFILDCTASDPEGLVEKKKFYNAYCGYCRKNNYVPTTEKSFSIRLRQISKVVSSRATISGRQAYCWKGIRLLGEEEQEEKQETLE